MKKLLQTILIASAVVIITFFVCSRIAYPIKTETFTVETVETLAVYFNMYLPKETTKAVYQLKTIFEEIWIFTYFIDTSDQLIAYIWKWPLSASPPPESRGEVSLKWAVNGRGIVCDAGSREVELPPYRPMKERSCLFWFDMRNHGNFAFSSLTQAELLAFVNSLELAK